MILKKQFVLMMKGFTATGKSTLAKKLAESLSNTVILHSAVIRKELGLTPSASGPLKYKFELDDEVFIKKVSPLVYGQMVLKANHYLLRGKNVILDGTYNFRWQREQVYEFISKKDIEFLIINCVTRDENEIKRRLNERKNKKNSTLGEVNAWNTYLSTKKLSEPLKNECIGRKKVKSIVYDTHSYNVRCLLKKKSEFIKLIISILKKA